MNHISFFHQSIRRYLAVLLCAFAISGAQSLLPAQTCCDNISIFVSPQLSMPGCCFNITVGTPDCLGAGTFVISELDINGSWNVIGSPVQYEAGFSVHYQPYCLTYNAMPGMIRFDFYDDAGILLCTRYATVQCASDDCCNQVTATMTSAAPPNEPNECCFDFEINMPYCMPSMYTMTISEMDWHGNWHAMPPTYTTYHPGQVIHLANYCLTYDAMPARIRFEFYDMNGFLLCAHEMSANCYYENGGGPGGTGSPDCCSRTDIDISAQLSTPAFGDCCYDISVSTPNCLETGTFTISELDWAGNWQVHNTQSFNPGMTTLVSSYCLSSIPMSSDPILRFDFYDQNGNLICSREYTVLCDPFLKRGALNNDETNDLVQHLSGTPNPVTDEATISYSLAETAEVTVELVDVLGQRITLQQPAMQTHGVYTLPLKTAALSNGMYTVVVKANGRQATINIVIAR